MRFLNRCVNRLESKGGRGYCKHPEHPEYKQQVLSRTCLQCTLDRTVMCRVTPSITREYPPDGGVPETHPQKPQKPHMEPPTISGLGTLVYSLDGWEVPPCPPGYVRRSPDLVSVDVCIFDPIRIPCKHLHLMPADVGACGYHRVKRRCNLIKSYVGSKTCETCVQREDLDAR